MLRRWSLPTRNVIRAIRCALISAVLLVGSCLFAQTTLEVEPGLTIPNAKAPWALETYQGTRQLVPLHHSVITVNRHTGANIAGALYGSFLYKSKITTELDGLNSRNQLHSTTPVFYLLLEEDVDPAATSKDSDILTFVISRVKQSDTKRIMDRLALNAFTGKGTRNIDEVAVDTKMMKDGWLQLSPRTPMPEGEYVILPVPKMSGSYSTVVWDFGINLTAPNERDVIPATAH